jgi:hypothetical protein
VATISMFWGPTKEIKSTGTWLWQTSTTKHLGLTRWPHRWRRWGLAAWKCRGRTLLMEPHMPWGWHVMLRNLCQRGSSWTGSGHHHVEAAAMVKDTSVGDSGSDHCSLGCPCMPVGVVDETFQINHGIWKNEGSLLFVTHGILIIRVFS